MTDILDVGRVASLNDILCRLLSGGTLVLTAGIVALGRERQQVTWTGAAWLIEAVQSPPSMFISYLRSGSGDYAQTPTSFTVCTATSTSGNNTAAASPYNLGFYAPCDGLYRLFGRTRFYNDHPSFILGGALGLSDGSAANLGVFDSGPFQSYRPGEYQDVISRCTKG
jgi:hypothetical protein